MQMEEKFSLKYMFRYQDVVDGKLGKKHIQAPYCSQVSLL